MTTGPPIPNMPKGPVFLRYAIAYIPNHSIMLEYPKEKSLRSFGDRSFSVAATKLWNELPEDIRNISSINVFKTALKTHLFKSAFNI